MPTDYPPAIAHTDFTDTVVQPTPVPPRAVRALRTAWDKVARNTAAQPVVELRDWKLTVPATGCSSRKSFDTYPAQSVRSNSREKRTHFAPDAETVHLAWDLAGASLVRTLRFTVYRRQVQAPLYQVSLNFGVGNCPAQGHFSWNGRLDQDPVCAGAITIVRATQYQQADFPGHALSVEHGPYKFKLVVDDPTGTLVRVTPARWLYVDVLLGKPKLDWLPKTTLAASPVLPTNGAVPVQRDHQVYDALTDANDAENLAGAVPAPGQTKRVYLQSHRFYTAEAELTENMAWSQMRALWGEGANIPLRLTPAVLRSDDTELTGAAALPALGAVKFAWEWIDAAPPVPGDLYAATPPDATPDYAAGQAAAQTFVTAATNFDAGTTQPPGRNCHVERGGKRGPGAPAVFPAQNGTGAFPFVVTAPAAGNWCAVSEVARAGAEVGHSGAVLQPSIQPGDGFRLRVAPVIPTLVVPTAAHGAFHTAMADMPSTVAVDSGAFVVWKTVEHTVYNSDPAGLQQADCDALAQRFARLCIRIRSQVQPITGYRNALTALYNGTSPSSAQLEPVVRLALAGDAAHTDDAICAWFKDWDTFRNDLIAHHGGIAAAAAWADAYNHPTRSFWRDTRCAFALPWPTHPIVFTDNQPANGTKVEVTLTGQHGAAVGTYTQEADAIGGLTEAVKRAITVVHNNIGSLYMGGDPPLTVAVRCPNGDRAAAALAVTAGLAQYTEGQCRSAYENSAGYAWGFRVVDLVLRDWLGPDDGLITLQFKRASNFAGSPAGKAGFAPAATRASINIFMLKTQQMLGTLCHEIGHAMFVNHQFYTPQGGVANDPRELHDDAAPRHCTMNTPAYQRSYCGFCMLRLRAWSIYKLDPARTPEAINPAPNPPLPDMHVRTLLKTGAQNSR